ncbi:hypothetical protein X801_10725, partial [Opisthorchis viverrini]
YVAVQDAAAERDLVSGIQTRGIEVVSHLKILQVGDGTEKIQQICDTEEPFLTADIQAATNLQFSEFYSHSRSLFNYVCSSNAPFAFGRCSYVRVDLILPNGYLLLLQAIQTMDNPNSEVSCCPHPFLPPSIYDIGPDGISVTENVHGGLDTPTSLGPQPMTALMRQESCSHRNCELPPVPDGSEPKPLSRETIKEICQKRACLPSEKFNMLAPYKRVSLQQTRTVIADRPLFHLLPVHHPSAKMPLQHAVIDEQQSESDGLYASVGHSGSTAIRDSAVPHRTSVVDSVHAPYYSSVSSMIAPNEYGDTSEDSVLRFHSHPTPQTSQIDNLYARVKPRFERAPVSGRLPREPNAPFVHAQTSAPGCSSAGPESWPSSTSSNQLNVRSVFFPATTQHNVVPLPFISPPPEPLPDGNNYGKISVRESLASLRARKAFPILEMSPFGEHPPPNITLTGQSEYEHVSGSASDTNNSTYEFTPQPTVYSGVRAFEAYATHGDIQDEQHLSDAYAELPAQPPLPERGYDQCEIGLVNRNRTFRTYFGSDNHSGTVGPSSTSSNQLNVRSVFFPATTQHNVVPLPFISPPPEPLPDGNNYGKISVRESLASLRARKAFPILEMSPFGEHPPPNITLTGQSEYEHVSGSASDTNNSTYEFTPQPTVYSGVRAFEAYATHGDIQDEQHLSDAYAEL